MKTSLSALPLDVVICFVKHPRASDILHSLMVYLGDLERKQAVLKVLLLLSRFKCLSIDAMVT